MNYPKLITLAIAVASAPSAHAEEWEKPVYRDAETHEQIVEKFRLNQEIDPMKNLVPSEGEDPSVKNRPKGLIESSDIISFNGYTTLVPKKSIIKIPPAYADRMDHHQPGNKVVGWLEFYTMNRGWITTVEVTPAQAEGREMLAEDLTDFLSKNRNLIVATYLSGPISMLPPKEPTEEALADNIETQNPNLTTER